MVYVARHRDTAKKRRRALKGRGGSHDEACSTKVLTLSKNRR
ncbi:hypothetical protein MNBD_ALPHA09-2208, partial [hydrothermal vent metagenome]